MIFGRRAADAQNELRVVEGWTTGYPSQNVMGERNYLPVLRKIAGRLGGGPQGEAMTTAVLAAEPNNEYDRNAVAVSVDGAKVGYLPREDAAAYSPVLLRLAASGVAVSVPARVWWGELGDADWMASVRLDLGPPGLLVPVNAPPSEVSKQLPPGNGMQVSGEDQHLDVLAPLVAADGQVAVIATLHEVTEQKVRTSKQVLEVRIDNQRVGRLTPASSDHLLAVVREAERHGVVISTRASVRGNALKAEVTIYPTKAADLAQAWIDELGTRGGAQGSESEPRRSLDEVIRAEAVSALPPPNWYPNPTGPGLRWWDGAAWTEHTHDQ